LKTLFLPLGLVCAAAAHAAPADWLDGTVLADCEYCKTDAFREERRTIANQLGPARDPASGIGYVVTIDEGGRFVWGRAALIGTGNLIRTDAHVLFADTGERKYPDGEVYFESMVHRGAADLIEIDLASARRGAALSPLVTDVQHDWAIARLREDAIEKFNGDRVFAFLWDFRVTHDEIARPDYRRAAALVVSREHTFDLEESCESVTDDDPSRHPFGVAEVFFIRCPPEHLQVGSSGSALAILSGDEVWSLGGQIVAGGISGRSGAISDSAGPSRALGPQLVLGNVPQLEQTLTIFYLQELIRRGLDPRKRSIESPVMPR
jgi:hypothetical protein